MEVVMTMTHYLIHVDFSFVISKPQTQKRRLQKGEMARNCTIDFTKQKFTISTDL